MASYRLGEPPYYNGFDPDKQYSSVLFRPGMVVQTQELNELQSILKQNIRNIGGVLLSDGDVIEGCQCIIADLEENSVAKKCTITTGKIYLDGNIYNTEETVLTLKGAGTETIGVVIVDEIITEKQDESLLDNSAGYANAQMSGAHRQKTYLKFVIDDEDAATIYTVVDGAVVNIDSEEDTTVIDKINITLARRTYDESGNYRVDGLQLSEKGTSGDDTIDLNISAGKAYIKGNELTRNVASTLRLDRATDLRLVETEVHDYVTGITLYELNNAPVIQEDLVVKAYIEATTNITKGVAGGSDPFPSEFTKNSVASIFKVWNTSHGDYEIGSNGDCRKQGNSIKWNGTGNEPDSGATYQVRFSYVKTMIYGVDYNLYVENGKYYIRILDTTNSTVPIDGTNIMVDYNFMLYRRDVITMDYLGNLKVHKGQSDTLSVVASPIISDDDLMVLGSVLLTPKSDKLGIINNTNKRLSMNELQRIAARLSNVEESLAMSNLDTEAMTGEDATTLVGIYTDGFIGLTKVDVDHNLFDCAIDLDNQEATLSAQETLHQLITSSRTDLSPVSSSTKYDTLITAPATETVLASVTNATGVKVINQYAVFSGNPVLNISPREYNWVDTNNITVQGSTVTKTVTLRRWWYHGGESWVETEKAQYIALGFADGGKSLGWSAGTHTAEHSAVASVLDTAILYMKQIQITVVGQMLGSYTDNIIVTFDGMKVDVTPTLAAYGGTMTGTLKANASGYAVGTFTVPANTLCGTVEVQMYPYLEPTRIASTSYTSNGTLRTTNKVVWKEVVKVNPYDPLAQTFQFDKDQFISSVGLYFCKSDGVHDVSVQIRGVTNGYPNQTCYAEKVLSAKELKVSDYATAETKVEFDDPVYCQADVQYCIVVLTESTTTSVFFAELGGKDVQSGVQLLKNPYMAGLMFSSSNAITWTAHQGSNLKFKIYGNVYNNKGYVYFNELNNVAYDRIMIMANVSAPTGTELTWEYSNDGGTNWTPIVLFNDMELTKLIGRVLVRAVLTPSADKNVSPAILMESCYFIGFLNNQECNYVSRNIVTDDSFYNIKQIVSIYDPDNTHTTVAVYYSVDAEGNSWFSGTQTKAKVLGNGWIQYTFEGTVPNGAKNFRARIYMTTNDSTIRPRVKNLMNILT